MTQAQRDRLVTLKKAKKHLITRREAAEELGVTVRHVRRLLKGMKERGDKVVIHAARGRPSPRKIAEATEQKAVGILSEAVCRGFRPTLAMEYLRDKHQIEVSKETVRQWMMRGQLWRGKKEKIQPVHVWRPRRSRCGELVQWDTSEHDWLEGRGEKLYLIAMIDDATSRLYARFAAHDSTEENMKLLWSYLKKFGRPVAFYTDKASLFQTAEKHRRDAPGVEQDPVEMPPTQIGRALRELGVGWIAAHSPQAKGRVERSFGTAQDRLVKGLRVAGARTLEAAHCYLEEQFLPWWNRTLTVQPAHGDDAHRPLGKEHDLAATLSHVEQRQVGADYTVRYQGKLYRIDRKDVRTGLRRGSVRVEQRLDGSVAMRFEDCDLQIQECAPPRPTSPTAQLAVAKPHKGPKGGGKSRWMEGFWTRPSPTLQRAIAIANATS